MMLKPYTVNEIARIIQGAIDNASDDKGCLLYTSPSPRD